MVYSLESVYFNSILLQDFLTTNDGELCVSVGEILQVGDSLPTSIHKTNICCSDPECGGQVLGGVSTGPEGGQCSSCQHCTSLLDRPAAGRGHLCRKIRSHCSEHPAAEPEKR